MAVVIIRLRGKLNIKPKIKDTLHYLRLNAVNHAVVLPENETTKGMLQMAKDYVTWGEVDQETLTSLLQTRGRIVGNTPLTDDYVKANSKFTSIAELAAAIVNGDATFKSVEGMKPLLRLHPARKGLEGIKRSVQAGGALGYRGASINDLLRRMS